jgi:hypothetical protein
MQIQAWLRERNKQECRNLANRETQTAEDKNANADPKPRGKWRLSSTRGVKYKNLRKGQQTETVRNPERAESIHTRRATTLPSIFRRNQGWYNGGPFASETVGIAARSL